MLRRLHSLPGLLAGLLLLILATSGAVLSLSPALERVAATVPARPSPPLQCTSTSKPLRSRSRRSKCICTSVRA